MSAPWGKGFLPLPPLLYIPQVLQQGGHTPSEQILGQEAARGGEASLKTSSPISPPPPRQAEVEQEALENDMFLLLCLQWLLAQ